MTVTELETLVFKLTADVADYLSAIAKAVNVTISASVSIKDAVAQIQKSFGGLNSQILSLVGVSASLGTVFKSVSLAADAEKMQVSFSVMLESAERGRALTQSLQQFAAATPLNMPEIQHGAKTLLQFGIAAGDIIPTLRQLGDVTGGDAQRFSSMTLAFGQMSATGRLMGQDLLQMINAGFNPLKEMARTTGKSLEQLKTEMESGRITLDQVKNAFKTATEEGGAFFGLMEEQSKTAGGLFSTMQDDIGAALRAFGEAVIGGASLKDVMMGISAAAQEVAKFIKEWDKELQLLVKVLVYIVGPLAALAGVGGLIMGVTYASGLAVTGVIALTGAVVALSLALIEITLPLAAFAAGLYVFGTMAGLDFSPDTIAKKFHDMTTQAPETADRIRESAKAVGQYAEWHAAPAERMVQDAAQLPEETGARRVAAKVAVEEIKKKIAEEEKAVKQSREAFEEVNTVQNRYLQTDEWISKQEEMDKHVETVKELTKQLDAAAKLAKDPADNAHAQQMLKHYKDELSMLWLNTQQKERQKALNFGITDELTLQAIATDSLTLANTKQLVAVRDHRRALEDIKATLSMTPGAKKLYEEEQKAIRDGLPLREDLKAVKLEELRLTELHHNSMKYSPFAKYTDEVAKLNDAKARGAVTAQGYALGMKELGKTLHDAANGAHHAWTEMQKVDQVEAHTAEAYAKHVAFAESIADQAHPGRHGQMTPEQIRKYGLPGQSSAGAQQSESGRAEALGKMDHQADLLGFIWATLKNIDKKKGLAGARLAGG